MLKLAENVKKKKKKKKTLLKWQKNNNKEMIYKQSWVDYLQIVIRYWFQITWQKL